MADSTTLERELPPAAPDPAERLMVNPYVTVVRYTDDEVLYRHGSRSFSSRLLRDDGRRRVLGDVLAAFVRPRTRTEVRDSSPVPDAAEEVIDRLVADGVLVNESDSRSAMYLQMHTGTPPTALAAATVGVVGLGGVGGQIGHQLAALGVGEVIGLDDRTVTAADLPTLGGTVGAPREAGGSMADAFRAATGARGFGNVSVRSGSIEDEAGLVDLLDDVDLLLVGLEGFPPSLLQRINQAAIEVEKAWLPAYPDGSEVIVGPLVVPGRSPCYSEYEIQHEASRVLRTEYLLYKEELAGRPVAAAPQLLPPYASIAASWAVTGALPYLLDGTSFLVGRVVRVDFERLEVINERVLRLPRCPACAGLRPDFRHPFL